MDTKQIRDTIKRAKLERRHLAIYGYIDSSGTVKDLVISFEESYRTMAERSLKLLPALVKPPHIDFETWSAAYEELFNSYLKYLSNPPGTLGRNNAVDVDGFSYAPNVDTIDTVVVILDVQKVSEKVIYAGEVKVVNSKAKTIAKDWMKSNLPEARYIPRLNLTFGKFQSLELV